ncbi:MAG: hypothetical protein WCG01_04010 [bacterium]
MNKETNKNQEETKTKKNIKPSNYFSIVNKVMVLLIVICGVSYLVGMNDLSIKHFVVQENKRAVRELKDQNSDLETRIMALSSYNTINKKIASLKMVKVDRLNYINVNAVVAKK